MSARNAVAQSVDDCDEFPFTSAPQTEEARDPAEVAALVLVRRVLDSSPVLKIATIAHAIAAVVQVPSAGWLNAIANAWGCLLGGADAAPEDADTITRPHLPQPHLAGAWFECRRDGFKKEHRPDVGNEGVSAALSARRSIFGFSPAPERHLPRDLLRVADVRAVIPPLDADALREVVTALVGTPPSLTISDARCRLITVEDLRLARRPGQDADDYVARLRTLLEAKAKQPTATLAQMRGMDEAVDWGMALVRDLADYRQGKLPWSAVDRGALLAGPSGTGKTTFARALAGSCDVPLVTGSLSRWQAAGHLGDMLRAMAATFDEARATAPCILFLDEVDSVGNRAKFTDHQDYNIQVVNALLEELDGIGGREGVVVVGACNHPDRLDPALTRSGRLDRTIRLQLPDRSALAAILRDYLSTDLDGVDLAMAAALALGGTGADCERWVRGARRRARHGNRDIAIDDLIAEIRGAHRPRTPELDRRYAVHEAGHALVIAIERPGALIRASIRGTATTGGGVTANLENAGPMTRAEVAATLRQLLAGRAAEEVLFGDVSAGAGGDHTSDLARATALAVSALCSFGLDEGEHGLLWLGLPSPDTIGSMLALKPDLADRVSKMLTDAYAEAKTLVEQHRHEVEDIANALIDRETIGGDEIEAMLRKAMMVCPVASADAKGERPETPNSAVWTPTTRAGR
ncbi:AAA family ATPase (plasmid) [Azospirillum sp. 412522]|nr:AAA family ATPase [Azospirillum sp. 412522]MBY6266625.1 AAA family ATPase [Azospirillum sp. 412522]